ncbi:MAG: 5'/3'-nucleotidase SurE, partial [Cyanobacteria bacterium J06639_1]
NSTDFQPAADFVCQWLETCRDRPFPGPALLNGNVPPVSREDICGVVAAPLGVSHYTETFEKRVDPRGKTYYWIAGEAIDTRAAPDSDIAAIRDNYITVTPLGNNLTAASELPKLADWGMNPYAPSAPQPAVTRDP